MLRLPPAVVDRLAEFVTEATSGPDKGGIAGQVRVGDRVVELAASRGWGVQVSTGSGPGTRTERVGQDATVPAVVAAIGRVLAA